MAFFGLLRLLIGELEVDICIVEPRDERSIKVLALLNDHPVVARGHHPHICAEEEDHPEQPSH